MKLDTALTVTFLLLAFTLTAGCGGREVTSHPRTQAPRPSTSMKVASPKPSKPSSPLQPIDPRLEATAKRWDSSKLPLGTISQVTLPPGPVLQLVDSGAHLDSALINSPSDLGGMNDNVGAVLLWLENTVTINDLLPYLAVLPTGTPLYVTALASDGSSQVFPLRAEPLEDRRCALWLALTDATVADLVAALPSSPSTAKQWYLDDNRVCGAGFDARLAILNQRGGTLFYRTDEESRSVCSELTFTPNNQLVREGDNVGRPRLVFESSIKDGVWNLEGPIDNTKTRFPILRYKMKFNLNKDDFTSIILYRAYPADIRHIVKWQARLFYTEADCLSRPVLEKRHPDILNTLFASTSAAPHAVVDRITPIAVRRGNLHFVRKYFGRNDKCEKFSFKPSESHHGGRMGCIDKRSVAYQGDSIHVTTDEMCNPGWEHHLTILPVVHTKEDHVLVNGERWYFSNKSCGRALRLRKKN